MSTIIMSKCWPLKMPPAPKSVLISLADNANDQGHCWPAITTICQRTCFKRTAVINAIKWLEDHGAISVDHTTGRRSNLYVITPSDYRGEVSGDYHYVYRITHVPSGMYYIGVRSCYCSPEKDDYWGSGQASPWLHSVREECDREILKLFDDRESAAVYESGLIRTEIGNPKCLNRQSSAPATAMGNPPTPLFNGASNERFAPRTVREATENGTRGGRFARRTVREATSDGTADGLQQSARRTPTVRETDPNRKEPSKEPSKATVNPRSPAHDAREAGGGEARDPEPGEVTQEQSALAVQASIALRRLGMRVQPAHPKLLALAVRGFSVESMALTASELALKKVGLYGSTDHDPELLELFASGATQAQLRLTNDEYAALRNAAPPLNFLAATMIGRAEDASRDAAVGQIGTVRRGNVPRGNTSRQSVLESRNQEIAAAWATDMEVDDAAQ